MRRRLAWLYAALIAGNLGAWAWALLAFRDHPVLLGTAFLAWSLGLRHAVDADHIAAIDNVTRSLMQRGAAPIGVGFWFSLGHATVVIVTCAAVALAAGAIERRFPEFRAVGGLIGTASSILFLFAIAAVNCVIMAAVWRAFRAARRGAALRDADLDHILAGRGLFGRIFRPLFRLVGKSWHMYPLGLLFGLGFDTATEVALLGIAGAEAAKGLPVVSILIFPALFTAGMSLIDTTDNVLMVGAYGWAFVKPLRKLYYNLTVTLVSVVVAVAIGGIEALGLLAEEFKFAGPFWDLVAGLNDNFGGLGYVIIAVFVASWIVSALIWRLRRFEEAIEG